MGCWIVTEKDPSRYREKITNKLWTLPKANANTVKIEPNDRALIYLTAPDRKFIGSFVISSRFHPPSDEQRELTRKWHPERNVEDVYYAKIEKVAEFDPPVPLKSVRDKLRFPHRFPNPGIALQQTPVPIDEEDFNLIKASYGKRD